MTVLFIIFICLLVLLLQWYASKLRHDRWLEQRQDPRTGLQGNPRAHSESYTTELAP